jgi:hypothetical protein
MGSILKCGYQKGLSQLVPEGSKGEKNSYLDEGENMKAEGKASKDPGV